MIFTARQLEEMHRGNGRIVLPYRARLTPLAQDWIRHKKIAVGYADVDSGNPGRAADGAAPAQKTKWLWWADGPCGPAKAALMTVARETGVEATEIGVDPKRIVEAIRIIARETRSGKVAGGILLVSTGAAAMVYANRCPSLRAVLGTCLDAVSQGTRLVAANCLVIEHPYKSLQQCGALMSQFIKARREISDGVKRQLSELSSCE